MNHEKSLSLIFNHQSSYSYVMLCRHISSCIIIYHHRISSCIIMYHHLIYHLYYHHIISLYYHHIISLYIIIHYHMSSYIIIHHHHHHHHHPHHAFITIFFIRKNRTFKNFKKNNGSNFPGDGGDNLGTTCTRIHSYRPHHASLGRICRDDGIWGVKALEKS